MLLYSIPNLVLFMNSTAGPKGGSGSGVIRYTHMVFLSYSSLFMSLVLAIYIIVSLLQGHIVSYFILAFMWRPMINTTYISGDPPTC